MRKYVLGIWNAENITKNKCYVVAKEKDVKFNDTVLVYSEKVKAK